MFERLALIGCGLMGGSFALACKAAGLVAEVVGTSRSAQGCARARELGVIDRVATTAAETVRDADLILVAVPVAATEEVFRALAPAAAPGALILDVGSTKQNVVAAAHRALGAAEPRFVPCHPIAGSETAGVGHARVDLYRNRCVVLTPSPATAPGAVAQAQQLWERLQTQVVRLSPAAHDAALAAVSHLPHLAAFAYMHGLDAESVARHDLALAGPGFRDFSRIAASDPRVWRDIFRGNREQLLAQLAHYQRALAHAQALLAGDDPAALEAWIAHASHLRAEWHERSPLPASSDVHHAVS